MCAWSLEDLFVILENLEVEMRFLTGLVYQLGKEADGRPGGKFRILHTLGDMRAYVSEHDCNYVLLICPDRMLVGLNGEGMRDVINSGELALLFENRWTPETLVIAVS